MMKTQITAVLALGLLAGPIAAQAQYDYELFDYPDVDDTQVFGINDRGDAVGNGFDALDSFPFVYDAKKGTLTDVAPLAGAFTAVIGNNDAGIMVGSVDNDAFIRDKKGNYAVFSHPDAVSFTQARAVNNKGLVTGFRDHPNLGGTVYGFIHDPKSDTYTDIISPDDHAQSIAQGINSKGEVVGSAFFLDADDPCGDSGPFGFVRKGWHRATDGTVTYFTVNGSPRVAARGITDSGTIAGFVTDPGSGLTKGFVVELDGSQCQSFTIADADLLHVPASSGTFVQGINKSGDVVGLYDDVTTSFGFIARPK